MSSSNQLAALPVAERNELERFLMDFDRQWSAGSLLPHWDRLSSEKSGEFLQSAAAELVKIDLRRGWAAGEGRLLEDYCQQLPVLGDTQSIDVDLILAEYDARQASDAKVTKQSYESRFPHQFPRFSELAEKIVDSSGVRRGPQRSQASVDTSRVGRARDTNPDDITGPIELPAEFGRYRLVKELGAGAMGMVYLAHDTQLDRQVALKTPTFKRDKQEELVSRFYREARAAAKIHHRNICPIYDVGEIDGQHFISMGFVRGRRLAEYISPNKLPPAKTSAVLVHRLTLALAEAHRHNIVHRDLKPANIMIDVKREPVVLDFGLARDTESETHITKSGMVVGTPAYMSPEQIRGDSIDAGPGSDVYALGVVLYELLTGRLPFQGSVTQVIYKVTSEAPPPPSELRSEVPPELEAICLKMMAKSPEQRYQSMDEAARDLKRFLKGKQPAALEAAESKGPGSTSEEQAEENPESEVGNIGETGVLNAFFAAQAAWDPRQTSVEPSVQAGQRNDPSPSRAPLIAIRQRIGRPPTWTKWTTAALAPVVLGILAMTFRVGDKQVRLEIGQQLAESDDLEVFLDGDQLSIAGLGETIELDVGEHQWEIRRGEQVIQGPEQYVVNRGENEVLRLEVEDAPAASGPASGSPASGSEDASSSEEIAYEDADGIKTPGRPAKADGARTPLPDGPPGEVLTFVDDVVGNVRGVEFTADGKKLLAVTNDGDLFVWDLKEQRIFYQRQLGAKQSLDTHPTKSIAAIGCIDKSLKLWDIEAGEEISRVAGEEHIGVGSTHFSPDGQRLMCFRYDGTIHINEVGSLKPLLEWKQQFNESRPLGIWHPTGKKVPTTCMNGKEIQVWDVDSGHRSETYSLRHEKSHCLAVTSSGRRLVVGTGSGDIEVWRLDENRFEQSFKASSSALNAIAISPDGRHLICGTSDAIVSVWDLQTQKEIARFEGHENSVSFLAISPDGRFVASGGEDGSDADGNWTADNESTVRIWRLPRDGSPASQEDDSSMQRRAECVNDSETTF